MADHYRIRFVIDPDARFEECNGEPRPLTEEEYRGYEYMRDGVPVTYADYLAYYGNPDRHVYIGAMLERRCTCCGSWNDVDSLWSIDCMDDNEEVRILTHSDRTYGAVSQYYLLPVELDAIPGHLRDVTRELLPDDADHVARTDADLITTICEIIATNRGASDAIGAYDAIRAVVTKRCEPVTGPDSRD